MDKVYRVERIFYLKPIEGIFCTNANEKKLNRWIESTQEIKLFDDIKKAEYFVLEKRKLDSAQEVEEIRCGCLKKHKYIKTNSWEIYEEQDQIKIKEIKFAFDILREKQDE